MYNKIVNPETNKLVNINSIQGNKVLNIYKNVNEAIKIN